MQESVIWVYVLWSCSPLSTLFKTWYQNFMMITGIKISAKLPFCSFIFRFPSLLGSHLTSLNMLDIKKLCSSVHLVMQFLKPLDYWSLPKFKLTILLFGSLLLLEPVFVVFLLLLCGLRKVHTQVKLQVKKEKVKYLGFFGLWWWLHKS